MASKQVTAKKKLVVATSAKEPGKAGKPAKPAAPAAKAAKAPAKAQSEIKLKGAKAAPAPALPPAAVKVKAEPLAAKGKPGRKPKTATAEGEAALLAAVTEAVGNARRIVDLFAGSGTFALPLSEQAEVHAVEGDPAMVAALDKASRNTEGLKPIRSEARDLFRRPLEPDELKGIDAVVNAVGVLRNTAARPIDAVHHHTPVALFEACRQAGVRHVVQISALGVQTGTTRYARTKRAADEHLLGLAAATNDSTSPLRGVVLRPSVVFGHGGARANLFLRLARLPGGDFSFDLVFEPTQPVLLQGDQGLSRKGPEPQQASYYYSVPQLQVRGSVTLKDQKYPLATGSTAWLDHEWSQEVLHPNAVGWDWIGINMLDGGALTAFRLRTAQETALWDGGSYRSGQGVRQVFAQGELAFTPQRRWTSTASRASYPVEWLVRTPAGSFTVKALLDDQELDSRSSTGAIYWEGLCEVWNTSAELVGRGYLEMTGYASPLKI